MKYVLLVLVLSLNLFAVDAAVKIEKDVENRARIAIVDASTVQNNAFFKILQSDFKISGNFKADTTHHKGDINSNYLIPALKSKEYVLKYALSQNTGTKLLVRLLRASNGAEVFKKNYTIPSKNKTPFLAHKAVSDINKALKYPDISWINRYVIYARYTTPGKSEIVLADYTFNYKKSIIKGGLNLFPKWADKDQKSFYYSAYNGLRPILYKMNIYTGRKVKMATSEGMLVCSDVRKDEKKILLTMAPTGQTDIYELDVASKSKRRVTKFNGIDVSGKYLDDDSSIVFVSDRLGYANIFKKGLSASSVSQVVYHGRNNNAVDTHGSKIVYASRESQNTFGANTFNIYLASSKNSKTRPLTTTGTNQFPTLSVDGNVILYIKHRGNSSSVGYINLTSQQSLLFPISGRKMQSIDW
ncbi:MAG: Tol-Pal system protein TolB [Sulfurovum sp.]|nr:Tol-Pal system protein TolB [Sulfurovum sp.]